MTPVYLEAAQVARILGWQTQRARYWLQNSGAGVKRAGRWVTTPLLLGQTFPEALERMLDTFADGDEA